MGGPKNSHKENLIAPHGGPEAYFVKFWFTGMVTERLSLSLDIK